jgi:hypothetical protein
LAQGKLPNKFDLATPTLTEAIHIIADLENDTASQVNDALKLNCAKKVQRRNLH